jgi:hypothetical protein
VLFCSLFQRKQEDTLRKPLQIAVNQDFIGKDKPCDGVGKPDGAGNQIPGIMNR